jgi:transcriptional regulator with XRE-family HTH domain
MRQADVADRAGVSQSWISRMERGKGGSASLETWAAAAAAVGEQLVGFLERAPGADRPRDYEHLKRQELIVATTRAGGWRALPEESVDDDWTRSRSVDVALLRAVRREAAVVEVIDVFDDVGAAKRNLDGKLAALDRRLTHARDLTMATWRVQGLLVVRGTRRNRALVREFGALFAASFPDGSLAWLRALTDPAAPMPNEAGFVWTDVVGTRLMEARLGRSEERT